MCLNMSNTMQAITGSNILDQEADCNYVDDNFLSHVLWCAPKHCLHFHHWTCVVYSFPVFKKLFHSNRLWASKKGLKALIHGLLCAKYMLLKMTWELCIRWIVCLFIKRSLIQLFYKLMCPHVLYQLGNSSESLLFTFYSLWGTDNERWQISELAVPQSSNNNAGDCG